MREKAAKAERREEWEGVARKGFEMAYPCAGSCKMLRPMRRALGAKVSAIAQVHPLYSMNGMSKITGPLTMLWRCDRHCIDNGHRSCTARSRQRDPNCNRSSAMSRCCHWWLARWQRHARSTGWPCWEEDSTEGQPLSLYRPENLSPTELGE